MFRIPRIRTSLVLPASIVIAIASCNRTTSRVENADDGAINGARSRLTDLAVAPATRRVLPRSADIDFEGRPSPNGRLVSLTDWTTGDLAVRNLAANTTSRLTNKGSWDKSVDFAEGSVISPDGKSIAYGWYSDSKPHYEMRIMPLAGPDSGRARTLFAPPDLAFLAPQAWTSDNRNVIGVIALKDQTTHIAVIPVDGRPARRLRSFDWRSPWDISVSPDGRWLAYDFQPDEENGERDVYVVALDGSRETPILPGKGDDFVAGWSADGSHLLMGSERAGVPGVWAVAMNEGKPEGEPVLVRSGMWHMLPIGSTRDGTIFYGVIVGTRDVYTAALDPKTGRVASRPASINEAPVTSVPFTVAWSPDGQHVASVVIRGRSSNPYGPADIVIRSLDRGEVRRISPKVSLISRIKWAPDGRSFVLLARDLKGRPGLFRMDLQSGDLTPLMHGAPVNFGPGLSLSPDGKNAFFTRKDSSFSESTVTVLDLATGAMRALYQVRNPVTINGLALNPDGRQLALYIRGGEYKNGIIALLPVAGGPPREIYRFSPSESADFFTGVSWIPNGQEILFGVNQKSDELNERTDVRALPATGGVPRSIGIPPGRIAAIQISPDGRRIAYGVNDFSAELWAMEPPKFEMARRTDGTK